MSRRRSAHIKGLVLKVTSRCNLNCTYCYVYNKGDTTYKAQPKRMSDATVEAILKRVAHYCRRHRLRHFRFIFHGGEPLLLPPTFYEKFVRQASRLLPSYTQAVFSLQTNGTLLTADWCQQLGDWGFRLGFSLDGPLHLHDSYRVDFAGQGSYHDTIRGLKLAQNHPALPFHPGVLCVIDPTTNPLEVFRHFLSLQVRFLNFLFPDYTHTSYPWRNAHPATPLADWLLAVFDDWWQLPSQQRPYIPYFQHIIQLILGLASSADEVGRDAHLFLIIDTDGSIEAQDSLKVCAHGITKEGYNVTTHSLEEALEAPLIQLCAQSHQELPSACRRCPIKEVCGGGFIVHRYHPSNGFDNPSVYCRDLLKLITHIQNKLLQRLPVSFVEKTQLAPLSYQEALLQLHHKV